MTMTTAGRAQGLLPTVDLYDSTGVTILGTVGCPNFATRPNAIFWKERLFIWNGALAKWVEGWAWFI